MNIFKKLSSKVWRKNYVKYIAHPTNKKLIEKAGFRIDGEEYYKFKNDQDMRYGRYIHASQFITEIDLKLTRNELLSYIDDISQLMNGQKFIEAGTLLMSMKSKAKLIFEEETMYRLASAVFFPLSENIDEYDYDFNNEKIRKFKAMGGMKDFFFKTPIREYYPVNGISESDLKDYLEKSLRRCQVIKNTVSQIKSIGQLQNKEELSPNSLKTALKTK